MLQTVPHDDEHLAMLRAIGFRSLMNVPVIAQGRVLGALGFGTGESGRRFGPDDLALAQELAQRAATAVDNGRLYRDAERARLAAEAANRAKSEFLSTMSHELCTPLNAIGGYVELLLMGLRGPLTTAQRQNIERMSRASQHLMGLVTDVLNFARLDAGQVEFNLADVELADLVGTWSRSSGLSSREGPRVRPRWLRPRHAPTDHIEFTPTRRSCVRFCSTC